MPGTYTPLNEWADENTHRQFPLTDAASGKDVTGGYSIPQNFMVDMILAVPPGYDTTKFFVKSLVVRRLFVDIEIGYDDGADLTVGWARNIPADAARNSVYYINAVTQDVEKDFEMLTGAVVIGEAAYIVKTTGVFEFNPGDAYIFPARVMAGLACVQSIQVGSNLLTGNMILKEGDNVSFDIDLTANTITVNAVINDVDTSVLIGSDDDLLDELVNRYGEPIVSINGQAPDAAGNFAVGGEDCTNIVTGPNSISIANPCAQPCCDKSMLTDVYGVLSQLNLRYAVLESYYQSIGLTLNQMQARMVGLESQ